MTIARPQRSREVSSSVGRATLRRRVLAVLSPSEWEDVFLAMILKLVWRFQQPMLWSGSKRDVADKQGSASANRLSKRLKHYGLSVESRGNWLASSWTPNEDVAFHVVLGVCKTVSRE